MTSFSSPAQTATFSSCLLAVVHHLLVTVNHRTLAKWTWEEWTFSEVQRTRITVAVAPYSPLLLHLLPTPLKY